jgi:hypothetical protein
MKKRVIVSFITEDNSENVETLSKETCYLIGNTLEEKGFTHIVVFPGLESETGQEFVVNFPPVFIDTSDYNNWDKEWKQENE